MFFYIGNNCPLLSLHKVNNRLFLDKGWEQKYDIWYKGYSVDCSLSDSLLDIIDGYQPAGKWCVIHNEKVYHPILRGFPLYTCNDEQTNLALEGFVFDTTPDKPTVINGPALSLDEASDIIGDILLENTIGFYRYNNIPKMNVSCSAGLDTITTWAIIDSYTKDYTLHAYIPKFRDNTVSLFLGRIREYESDLVDFVSEKYWGYDISSFFTDLNWYASSYYAETYQYRAGEAINALANYQGKRIDELAKETDYLYWFLKRPDMVEKYKDSMIKFNDDKSLKDFLYSTIFYDHQYWHIDNNITFNPFADIRIPHTIHRMSIEDLTTNCTTGIIQRKIVERFNPQLLSLVSDYKSAKLVWENFRNNFKDIKLDPNVIVIIR
jgi:hypothetical protein